MKMKRIVLPAVLLLLLLTGAPAFSGARAEAPAGPIIFASTQMVPAVEQAFARGKLLQGFTDKTGIPVEYVGFPSYAEIQIRMSAEVAAKKVTTGLVGDLHGGLDVMNSQGLFQDLSGISLSKKTFVKSLEDRSVIAGKKVYIPWMQATYVMAINKKAFDYLPAGLTASDVEKGTEKWTYDALLQWAKALKERLKTPQLGFPIGPQGLWHRFLHGYIYPSYTGYQARAFNSPEAVAMWQYMKSLLPYVHTASTTWSAMDEPLQKEEVLIAWDHTARLKAALTEKPDQIVIAPVPRGPKGRGYITVAVGLAVPVNAPQKDNVVKLIDYLTSPEVQVLVLENIGFFPVVAEAAGAVPAGPLKILAQGVLNQSATSDSIMVLIPSLGARSGEFTGLYRDVFTKIVLENADIASTLGQAEATLKSIFDEVGGPVP
jgi:multiple sugar transport system substrate-binding protein